MIATQSPQGPREKCVLNVLPCRINHNGPVSAAKRYWAPKDESSGVTKNSYFRGRKLHGRKVAVPPGYRGVVVSMGKKVAQESQPIRSEGRDEEEEETVEVGMMAEQAEVAEVMVWGHEALPDESADAFVRGLGEWVAFADQMHSYSTRGGDDELAGKRS